MNMRQASEMSIYGGKKADAVAEQLDTRAEQMITSAKPEVSYVGERGAVGAAQSAEGIVNALGYMGQALSRTQNLQASQDAAMWAAVTGSDTQKALFERLEQTALDSAREGLQDTVSFGDEYDEKVEKKYSNADISDLGRGAAVVSEGIGGMLPYIAASAVGGPAISTATMFFSSMGNATQEAKREGYDDLRAMAYGSAVGAVEVATERMFDGMAGIFGKGAFDDVVRGTIRKAVKNEGMQKAVNYLVGMGGEGVEEFFAELGTRVANELTINNDDRTVWQTFRDGGKSALVGALISGIMQAGGNVAQIIRTDPAKAARQAAHAVIAEVKAGRSAVQPESRGTVPEGGKKAEGVRLRTRIKSSEIPEVKTDYTVERDINGNTYIQINKDVLQGVPESEWKTMIRNTIQKIFGTGLPLPRGTVFSNKKGRGEYTNGSYTRMLERTDPEMYADKLRMAVGSTGIVENASNIRYEDASHDRADDIVGFNRGNIMVSVKGNGYSGDVLTAIYSNGKETFFDINNLNRQNIEAASPERYAARDGFTQTGGAASNPTVPQAVPGVNGQYMHNAPSVFLPGSGLEGTWTAEDGLLPVDEKLAKTSRWLLPLDEKLAEQSMLPLSEAARQAGQTAVENRAAGEYTGGEESAERATETLRNRKEVREKYGLTDDEENAVLQYKSSTSYKINAKLREGMELNDADQAFVDTLDAALEKLPVHEGPVIRRIGFWEMFDPDAVNAFLAQHKPGAFVAYDAYSSASTAEDGYPIEGDVVVELRMNSKTARNVAGFGNNFESEVIFPRNTLHAIVSAEQTDNSWVITTEEALQNNGKQRTEDVSQREYGQLYSEERGKAMQRLQAPHSIHGDLQGVPERNTLRGSGGQAGSPEAYSGR